MYGKYANCQNENMIKAILFDYDETLVQTLNSKIPAYVALAKEKYNFDLLEETIRKSIGKPYEEFIYSLYGNVDSVENIILMYKNEYSPKFPNKLYPECLETINSLLKIYYVGIVSGYSREIIIADLTRLQFPVDSLFYIQTMEDSDFRKPDPRVFEPLFKKTETTDVAKNEIVYVGDDTRDFEAAKGAGIHFIAISDHTTPSNIFIENEVLFIKNFSELPDLVEKLNRE